MGKINILPAKVYNVIAAGEVIEHPYCVVKELVENSIDAGATEIEIYVEKGGRQLIRVVDNGCGIERDDLHAAFLPHATSKISKAEDLQEITTLGFRGEAVASIAAVSKTTITSRVEGKDSYRLSCVSGEIGSITQVSGDKGTDISVERLYFNAPVRLKYLKQDKAEEADIYTYVARFILNCSNIAFTYYLDGEKILQSFGAGDEDAFLCVYGAGVRAKCIEIDAKKHGVHIWGYIGNQNFFKSNKSYQNIFLNGRYVLNTTLASAVSGAYSSYLMKRQYPFYVLHITVPPQIIDVNVHPHKSDVRFLENNMMYGCVYSVISAVLDGKATALDYIVADKNAEGIFSKGNNSVSSQLSVNDDLPSLLDQRQQIDAPTLSQRILAQADEDTIKTDDIARAVKSAVFDVEKTKVRDIYGFGSFTYEDAKREIEASIPNVPTPSRRSTFVHEESKRGFLSMDEVGSIDESQLIHVDPLKHKKYQKPNPKKLLEKYPDLYHESDVLKFHDSAYENAYVVNGGEDFFSQNKRYLTELDEKAKQNGIDLSSCVYVGKLFNTYLLYECNADVFIIDQHAAHERLIFDRLKKRMQDRNVARQPMLLPYELSVNPQEALFLRERLKDINDMGFDITEGKNNVFLVSSLPVDLQNIDLSAFFNLILSDIEGYHGIKLEEVLKDKLATAACKAAVKGGMDLTKEEIDELFRQMDGNMGLKCPHGRPVVVKMARTELEKMFKRIV